MLGVVEQKASAARLGGLGGLPPDSQRRRSRVEKYTAVPQHQQTIADIAAGVRVHCHPLKSANTTEGRKSLLRASRETEREGVRACCVEGSAPRLQCAYPEAVECARSPSVCATYRDARRPHVHTVSSAPGRPGQCPEPDETVCEWWGSRAWGGIRK